MTRRETVNELIKTELAAVREQDKAKYYHSLDECYTPLLREVVQAKAELDKILGLKGELFLATCEDDAIGARDFYEEIFRTSIRLVQEAISIGAVAEKAAQTIRAAV